MVNFGGFKATQDQATIVQAEAEQSTGGKFFEPGQYIVKVKECTFSKMNEKDPTWASFQLVLGDEKRSIRLFPLVPTKRETFGEKKVLLPYFKLVKLLTALGCKDVNVENLPQWCELLFGKPEKIKGASLDIIVKYEGYYARFLSKDLYGLFDPDNKPVLDNTNTPITADKREVIEKYCKDTNLAYKGFVDIVDFGAPQKNRLELATKKAAAVEGIDEDEEDTPF
jgi:hypothetical protein